MFSWPRNLNAISAVTVQELMNTQYQSIHPDDSLRTVIATYQSCKLDTLPVVDNEQKLVGVFPRRRLYDALLECPSLDSPCTPYVVFNPKVNHSDARLDQELLERIMISPIGNVPVQDPMGNLVGMIGKHEYLRETVNMVSQATAFWESAFYAIYDGIIVVDNTGNILSINKSAEEMFGLNYSDVLGKSIDLVLRDLDISDVDFTFSAYLRNKRVINSLPVIITMVPIISMGERIGINIIFQNLSEIEKLAEELEITRNLQSTLAGVLNASENGIIVTGESGEIKYVNQQAAKTFGVPSDRILGKQLNAYIPANVSNRVSKTGLPEVDIFSVAGDGCVISFTPIKDEHEGNKKTLGVVSIMYMNDSHITEEISRKWLSLKKQVKYYRDELEKRRVDRNCFEYMSSTNVHFSRLIREAEKFARSNSTILLTGESGVGKDMLARAIHGASSRANQPFVKVNCAAIPQSLFESELFGYAPGSFTGASKRGKTGYFEQANKGTIFLDEIGEMALTMQAKLLQVIQERQFMRVGGVEPVKVDTRIIAATNRDLRKAVSKGTFRKDLYYRLNVIELRLPPLRERAGDIPRLIEYFVKKYNKILGTHVIGISNEAQEALINYTWPGNIRELENVIERAANYVWEGIIELDYLPNNIKEQLLQE